MGDPHGQDKVTFLVHNEPVAALLGPPARSRVRIRGPQSSGGSRSRSRTCGVSPPLTALALWVPRRQNPRPRRLPHRAPLLVRQKWPASKGTPRLPSPGARIRPAAAGNENGSRPHPAPPQPGAAARQPATPGVQGRRPALTVRLFGSTRLLLLLHPVSAAEPRSEHSV